MQELKDQIILSAQRLFLIGTIKQLDLDLIANDCGISRETLAQCFKRNELIDAVIKSSIETNHQTLLKIGTEPLEPLEEMTKMLSFAESLGYDFSIIL